MKPLDGHPVKRVAMVTHPDKKKKLKTTKKPKKAYGGKILNQFQSPTDVLSEFQNDFQTNFADSNAEEWAAALEAIGSLAASAAGNYADSGNSLDMSKLFGGDKKMSFGGTVPVEVEGKETAELPNGEDIKFQGPSHEQGGIDTNLPEGTNIYADRLSIGGETMAERENKRKKKEDKLERILKLNPTDQIAKKTYQRVKELNDQEREEDKAYQNKIRNVINFAAQLGKQNLYGESKAKFGLEDIGNFMKNNSQNFGDAMSIFGDVYPAFALKKNTERMRAGEPPVENYFKDFGLDSLKTLDEMQSKTAGMEDKALMDLERKNKSQQSQNRNLVRGANEMLASNLVSQMQTNKQAGDIKTNFAKLMMDLMAKKSGTELQRDQMTMFGESKKADTERRIRDNYFTQNAEDITTLGESAQHLGKDVNARRKNDISEALLNWISKYGIKYKNGEITKEGIDGKGFDLSSILGTIPTSVNNSSGTPIQPTNTQPFNTQSFNLGLTNNKSLEDIIKEILNQ